ncbi:4-oxalocrotonate tautomerase [Entomomonas moraniae]|uniref:2-hydroxymuconate tautomerase n=1 Tax=Entomomonas moraniae TaxID=2213226 RepID=A0A3S9XBT7_9GAMM|nr:4-oxalocrotonate tautomerase DmpI [Entomomonas moraniae]AZS49880.1 4-oxalocrotonate tautomerase [Entomomonas moraniae]
MPVITLEITPLTMKQKKELVEQISDIAARITDIPKSGFYVYIKENSTENIGVGGKLVNELAPHNALKILEIQREK